MSFFECKNKIKISFEKILNSIEAYVKKGSGWRIKNIRNVCIKIAKYSTYRGGCISELPKELSTKRAILNLTTNDNKCFLWSVLAGLFPSLQNPYCVTKYKRFQNILNTSMLTYLVPITLINAFEIANNIKINVMGYNKKNVIPLRLSTHDAAKEINLLLFNNHYFLIRNIN